MASCELLGIHTHMRVLSPTHPPLSPPCSASSLPCLLISDMNNSHFIEGASFDSSVFYQFMCVRSLRTYPGPQWYVHHGSDIQSDSQLIFTEKSFGSSSKGQHTSWDSPLSSAHLPSLWAITQSWALQWCPLTGKYTKEKENWGESGPSQHLQPLVQLNMT